MKVKIWIFLIPIFFLFSTPLKAQVDSWPREYIGKKGGRLVVYQPQLESWDHYTTLVARVASAVSFPGAKTSVLGTFKLTGTTEVDKDSRKVRIKNIQLTEVNFPTLDPQLLPELTKAVQETLPKNDMVIALDRVLANLERSQESPQTVEVNNDPPPIYFSANPAILVNLDGPPIWSPITGTNLKYAVNTNWDLFQDVPTEELYLRNEGSWLKSKQIYGPWVPAWTLPPDFEQLPKNNENWKDVLASIPGKPLPVDKVPTVFVSLKPAEMIVTQGPPKFVAIPGTALSYVSNTDSNLFLSQGDRNYYYLVSGRWFRHPGGDAGQWTFASDSLPQDFKNIPEDSPKANILAEVPGTPEAEEAVIAANIPQKAKVKRTATAQVEYSGEPEFKPIEKTDLKYATNTPQQVIEFKGKYYMVKDGVWFTADNPKGPWTVADKVPNEIYSIPPSSSLYNVTYVKVYDSDADTVTTGYTAGYMGAFVVGTALGAALTYGSGWYYPPYYYGAAYYPRPYSYGTAAYYNPWTGGYYGGARYYGPYGGAGYGASYNPATGTYARGAAAYGPYGGYKAGAQAYNPYTNTYAQTRQGGNAYSSWGSSYVQQGNDWAKSGHYTQGGKGVAGYQTSGGNSGFVAKGNNDVYAGHNGNVYRKTDNGWQKYDNGGWNNVEGGKQGQLQNQGASSGTNLQQPSQQAQQGGGAQAQNKEQREGTAQQKGLSKENAQGSRQQNLASQERTGNRSSSMDRDTQNQLNRDSSDRARGNQQVSKFDNYQRSGGSRDFASQRGGGGGFDRGGGGGGFSGGGGGGGRSFGGGGGGGRRR